MSFRWYYVDDSGAPQTGWIVYGYLELDAECWGAALDRWLDFRTHLWERHQIPDVAELHAVNFINGRGNPSRDVAWNRDKGMRHEVAKAALQLIAELPRARAGAVVRHTEARRHAYGIERSKVYGELIGRLSVGLERRADFGAVVLDGDGTDPSYTREHRRLDRLTRRIVEDPVHQPAHGNQLLQAADLISYSAYQAVRRDPAHEYMHDWFERYLAPIGELHSG